MDLPEIPKTWLIALVVLGVITLRAFGIDTFITGALAAIIGYLTGQHVESTTQAAADLKAQDLENELQLIKKNLSNGGHPFVENDEIFWK